MTRETQAMSTADLLDPSKVVLYGADAINREIAIRQQSVNLRWDEQEHPDPEDAEWRRDPIGKAGIQAHRTSFGDGFERELCARNARARREIQPVQHEVAEGCTIVLPNGKRLEGGAELAPEMLGKKSDLVLAKLRELGIVSSVEPQRAWLNALPSDVGPYVVSAETLTLGSKTLKRGEAVSEAMFPALVGPKPLTDDMPASALTVADLRRLIAGEIQATVPGLISVMAPPPVSGWLRALMAETVVQNPHYRAAPVAEKAAKQK